MADVTLSIPIVVGGKAQTGLSVTVTLTWSGGGTRPATPVDVDLDGWTNLTGWDTVSSDTWDATYTRAAHPVGTSTILVTVGAGTTEGTITMSIDGSSDQIADPSEAGDTVTVAAVRTFDVLVDGTPEPVAANGNIALEVTPTIGGGAQTNLGFYVKIAYSVDYGASPPTAPSSDDLDGWSAAGAWTWDDPTNAYYCAFLKASHAVGTSTLLFTVNAGDTAGTVTVDSVELETGQVAYSAGPNDSDTITVVSFDATITSPADASSFDIEGGTQDLHAIATAVAAGATQANGTFTVVVSDNYGGGSSRIDAVTTTALDGWSESGWSIVSGIASNTFTKASVAVGSYDIEFDVQLNGACQLVISTNDSGAPQTDEATGTGSDVDVDINDTGAPSWTVDATSGIAYPADATEMAAFLSSNGLSMPAPTSIYNCQDASSGAVDANGTRNMSAVGSLSYQQAVAGHTRLGISIPQATNSYITNNSVANLNTNSGLLLAISVVTDANALRSILAMGASVVDTGILQTATGVLRADNSAGTSDGSNQCPFAAAGPYGYHQENNASLSYGFHDTERQSPTYGAIGSSTRIWIGSCGGTSSPQVVTYALWWEGTNAEAAAGCTPANLKAFLQAMGFTITWT